MASRLQGSECLRLLPGSSVTDDVKVAAGDVLVALSHSHFRAVMSEIRGHLKALAELSKEFVFNRIDCSTQLGVVAALLGVHSLPLSMPSLKVLNCIGPSMEP
ncbi:hypothetical protein QYF61_025760 [Mycteria americana]|uniref:Uncharacterized protein n=1 Tax=Mycteria americana TaxID=33587 RepID=A0AAN7RRV7_MYCAM|nr:hypothetical protein QYF61_025760 [Mycteria americana]